MQTPAAPARALSRANTAGGMLWFHEVEVPPPIVLNGDYLAYALCTQAWTFHTYCHFLGKYIHPTCAAVQLCSRPAVIFMIHGVGTLQGMVFFTAHARCWLWGPPGCGGRVSRDTIHMRPLCRRGSQHPPCPRSSDVSSIAVGLGSGGLIVVVVAAPLINSIAQRARAAGFVARPDSSTPGYPVELVVTADPLLGGRRSRPGEAGAAAPGRRKMIRHWL